MKKLNVYTTPAVCVMQVEAEPLLNTSWSDGETQKPVIEGDPDDIDSKKFHKIQFGGKSPWEK
jgi:hypothetical protein